MTYLGQTPRPGSLLKEKREKRKRQKTPAEKRPGKHPEHLANVRELPCAVCGKAPPSECHHVKTAEGGGMGMRVSDRWVIPLCAEHHCNGVEKAGSKNEVSWFQKRGVDALTLASALWANRHDYEQMAKVLHVHRR